MNILHLLNRSSELFINDITERSDVINELVKGSRFLVIGAAGSIGQAVTKEIFERNPKCLHVVDISENNLVELVRYLRSSIGYIDGDFRTFAIDCGSDEFCKMVEDHDAYDYVLNLSAMKHVRSEKDQYSLMRMIRVNILNTTSSLQLTADRGASKYFCVSTDKAANPVNLMGASKRIMEMFLARDSEKINISTARFANVAFSDGSLLWGFKNRLLNHQPLTAPFDVRRYFVTPKESGELCLLSTLFGSDLEIFFPKASNELQLTKFSDIAIRFLNVNGFDAYECSSEIEARERISELLPQKKWPVYFFQSDTTGEKDFEEFFTEDEDLNLSRFHSVGVIENCKKNFDIEVVNYFEKTINDWLMTGDYDRKQIINLFNQVLLNFEHLDTGNFLDNRM